ncbi:endonuclease/exonuclease/phosphatase family protein [Microbacterium marinilacus]|uniref:endonuclease/exonuclease/phosphatase family protein n=1 Tax=Microbacterium marinilacus TaxID=415209 RepID=UPI001C8D4D53|nr:endonuclease/exonuclease/phosphatase family protein [Microbacterium marinilacus]MBY0687514.1 endonuclease/exonuclease/phosphatase family protein [Microbacterium marinilacus]
MLRVLGVLVTVVFACATAVVTWPQFFHLEQTVPFAQIVSMRGVMVGAFALITLVFLLFALARPMRGFAMSMALVAGIGAIAGGLILAQRGYGDTLPPETESSVRVMTWNTAGDATGAEQIAQTAVAMNADVVALPETAQSVGEDVAVQMRELGRPMWVHHVQYNEDVVDGPQSWVTTILITPELGDYAVIDSSREGTSNMPSAVAMPVNGDGPTIVAVHAVAPRPQYMSSWSSDLRWLADQCPAGENVILAGDFNATLDHTPSLAVDGADFGYCRDSAAASGNGGVGTWPTDVPALLSTPIDHVMHSEDWETTGSVVLTNLDDAGSDHRPLVVQLEPAG